MKYQYPVPKNITIEVGDIIEMWDGTSWDVIEIKPEHTYSVRASGGEAFTSEGYWHTDKGDFECNVCKVIKPNTKECYTIPDLIKKLLNKVVFYTEKGTKIKYDSYGFYFGNKVLDFSKIVDVPLYRIDPTDTSRIRSPFPINPKYGTYCKVWDNDDPQSPSTVIIVNYRYDPQGYCFLDNFFAGWQNAVPITETTE